MSRFRVIQGGGDEPQEPHPSEQGKRPSPSAVASVFDALATGLQEGRIEVPTAVKVLSDYARMLMGGAQPPQVSLRDTRPSLTATDGNKWAAWGHDRHGRYVPCDHAHRTREAAIACLKSGRGKS